MSTRTGTAQAEPTIGSALGSTSGAAARTERVVAVVVSHNSAAELEGLLPSLSAGMGAAQWQLVVADNASVDGSGELVRRTVPDATVLDMGRNAGYAAGINAAVRAAAPHTAVLILNADVRLDPGCVDTLLVALRAPGTGIVVPRLHDSRGDLIESLRREPTLRRALGAVLLGYRRAGRLPAWGEVVTTASAYEHDTTTDWAEGSMQLVSSECWAACEPWDESYFLYSEETDFDLRARDAGYATRYVVGASATHLEGGSGRSVRLWPLLVANQVRLYGRRHGRPATAAFWALTLVREVCRSRRPSSRAAVRVLLSPRRLAATRGPEWLA